MKNDNLIMNRPDNEQHMSKHRTKVGKRPLWNATILNNNNKNKPQSKTTKRWNI